jgi:hypothetical protein
MFEKRPVLLFLSVKRSKRGIDHLRHSSAGVDYGQNCTSTSRLRLFAFNRTAFNFTTEHEY